MLKTTTLCIAPVTLAACLSHDPAPDDHAPADFHDAKGNVWRMRGPATLASSERPEHAHNAEARTDLIAATHSDSAASLRAVAYFDGNEYELVATDEELRTRYEALLASGPMGGAPGRPQTSPRPSGAIARVFGSDDRIPLGYNSIHYPSSAVGATESSPYPGYFGAGSSECTMTLIGPSTAISAAHCFYTPGVGWHPMKTWSFGVTSWIRSGTTSVDVDVHQAYPTHTGCYWVTVPAGWVSSRPEYNWSDSFYDFAVIELSNSQARTCNLYPGHTVGWYGWWTASDAQIAGSNARINGYPAIPPAYSSTYAWPSQFTQGDYIGTVSFNTTDTFLLFTRMDITGGDSGSALAQELFAPGDRYATGIVISELPDVNLARRIDATVRSFVLQYSAL